MTDLRAAAVQRQQVITTALTATRQRLAAAAGPLGLDAAALHQAHHRSTHDRDPTGAVSVLLQQATDTVRRRGGLDRLWLLLAAAQGQLPVQEDVRRLRRQLELDDDLSSSRFLLRTAPNPASGFPLAPTIVVQDRVLVDIGNDSSSDRGSNDSDASSDGATDRPGPPSEVQRVLREILGRWVGHRPVLPVTWDSRQVCPQLLSRQQWHDTLPALDRPAGPAPEMVGLSQETAPLVLPWRVTYLLTEVPRDLDRLDRLSALARYSGSRLVVLGTDLSAFSDPRRAGPDRAGQVARYLSAVKHSAKVVALTHSAAEQFTGFAVALSTQGLTPPVVTVCPLATEQLTPEPLPVAPVTVAAGSPLVVTVGPLDATHNQLALLQAADILWREGLTFRLELLGRVGPGSTDVLDRTADLVGAGRDVALHPDPTGADQRAAYQRATFSVCVPVHDALGLQVTASLTSRTPVVATRFGSAAEAAGHGGALLVDPHDDEAIADAMRTLLTDPARYDDLVQQCRSTVPRSWSDCADQLWEHIQADGQDHP